jgi:NTP pyrophosphatase (non-canonical NTP hydrolase)
MIRKKVGVHDRKMGAQFLLNVLVEEVGELSRALRKGMGDDVAEEVCDVIFAAISIANVAGVEVEPVLKRKYIDRSLSDISREWTDVNWR